MILQPNWTYRFKFINKFSIFDDVYTVARIYSYPEFLKEKVDLYETLYAPCNLTEAEYDQDCSQYFTEPIFQLQKPNDESDVLYVPSSVLESAPIYNVQEYKDVAIAFHLGVFPSAEEFKSVMSNISEEISTSLGIEQEPKIILLSKEYLTDDEYKKIQDTRNYNKSSVLNYFSENIKLNREILSLRTRIQKLEDYILKMSKET